MTVKYFPNAISNLCAHIYEICFICAENLNKLSKKYQSYMQSQQKSTHSNKKICNVTAPSLPTIY